MAHPGTLGRQVDIRFDHARNLPERFLNPTDTGRAGHIFDAEFSGFFTNGVTGALDGTNGCLRIGAIAESDIGALGGQVDRGRLHAGNGF
ncbi:hypothetical protein D3C80_746830 [compost metagenome]